MPVCIVFRPIARSALPNAARLRLSRTAASLASSPAQLRARSSGGGGEQGCWQPCPELQAPGYDPGGPLGANCNLLIGSAAVDLISGTASHRSYLCEIRRAAPA
jgi:hypothetical protein